MVLNGIMELRRNECYNRLQNGIKIFFLNILSDFVTKSKFVLVIAVVIHFEIKLKSSDMLFEALIPITMFAGFFAMIIITTYINRNASHKERMALIENGLDASVFEKKKKVREKKPRPSGYGALKFGMLAVGLGLGLVTGSILNIFINAEPLPHFAMMLICGGGALIAYYNIIAKREKEEKERKEFEQSNFTGDELV